MKIENPNNGAGGPVREGTGTGGSREYRSMPRLSPSADHIDLPPRPPSPQRPTTDGASSNPDVPRASFISMEGAKTDIERGRGLTASEAAAKYNITHSEDLKILRATETRVTNSGGPRAHNGPFDTARESIIYDGSTAEEAAAAHGITHRKDLEDLRAVATRVANSGGPRARGGAIINAQSSIKNDRLSVEQAAANFGIKHPEDLDLLRQFERRQER